MTWLQEWWVQSQLDRRAMLFPDNSGSVPAYPWLPDGTPMELHGTPYPLSFVNAALRRFPVLMNLDALHRSVADARAGKADTRTHYERSRAAWQEYLLAKAKYEPKAEGQGAEAEAGGSQAGDGP